MNTFLYAWKQLRREVPKISLFYNFNYRAELTLGEDATLEDLREFVRVTEDLSDKTPITYGSGDDFEMVIRVNAYKKS